MRLPIHSPDSTRHIDIDTALMVWANDSDWHDYYLGASGPKPKRHANTSLPR